METLASQVVLTTDVSLGEDMETDKHCDPSVNISTPVSATVIAPKWARINIKLVRCNTDVGIWQFVVGFLPRWHCIEPETVTSFTHLSVCVLVVR